MRKAPSSRNPKSLQIFFQDDDGLKENLNLDGLIKACVTDAFRHHQAIMPALVIKSFPEPLHAKLRQIATAHRRSLTQETIHLIEKAIAQEEIPARVVSEVPKISYWANRKLLPEWEAALKAGAFSGGTDSTQIISEERDAR